MNIQKIEIEQFGGLKNFTLLLSGGVQYLYGVNEAGKSTLCAFVAAMFYGMPAKVRGAGLKGDSRSLYMPWGETYMAGMIYFEADGVEYVLKRRFGQTARGDKISLMLAKNWQEVSVNPDELGRRFLGVGEEAFYKTLYISQLGAAFEKGKEDELMTRLLNLEKTGDEDASVQKALSELERGQHELLSKTGRGGVIPQLDSDIEALKTELLEAKNRLVSFRSLLSDIQKLTAEKEAAEKQLQALEVQRKQASAFEEYTKTEQKRAEQNALKARLAEEKNKLLEATGELEALQQKQNRFLFVQGLSADVVLSIAEKEAACRVMENRLKEQEMLAGELDALNRQIEGEKERITSVPLIAGMAVLLVLAVALGIWVSPALYGLSVISLVGAVIGIRGRENKNRIELLAQRADKEAALLHLREETSGQKLDEIRQEIQSVFDGAQVDSLSALTAKIEASKAITYEITAARQDVLRLEEGVKNLTEEVAALVPVEEKEAVFYEGPAPSVLDAARERALREQMDRERELAQKSAKVESGFSGTRSVAIIESALEEAREERQKLYEQYEAICLAHRVMETCAEEMKNTFAPVLNEKSGAIISELTKGRYQDVRVSDNYKIMLKTPDGNEIIQAEYVSAGTYDLLYFALRMAVLQTLFESVPLLVLDDAFLQLDDGRQKEAFDWLLKGRAEQVLYFSCHKPPADWTGTVITL